MHFVAKIFMRGPEVRKYLEKQKPITRLIIHSWSWQSRRSHNNGEELFQRVVNGCSVQCGARRCVKT